MVYQGGRKMSYDRYVSPLSERYASKEMQYVFSPDKKFRRGEDSGSLWQRQKKNWDCPLRRSRSMN